jgi:hypothetical protein
MQIVPLTLKEWVLFDVENDIKITGRTTKCAGFPQTREANTSAVFHPCGDLGVYRALFQDTALTLTLGARICNDAAGSLARGTSAGDAEKALLVSHLASTAAGAASDRGFARSGAGAVAILADFVTADAYLGFGAEHGFVKFDGEVFPQVGSPLSPAATTAATSKNVPETEELAEDIAEVLEDSGIEAGASGASAAHASMAKAVIERALLRVGEDRIRLRDLLKFFFRVGIVRVAVGVMLHGELAVCALDLLLGASARNPENLVVVAFSVAGQNNLSCLSVLV